MAKYRDNLPQLGGGLFLTDGGIETTLIFHDGLDLSYFAAGESWVQRIKGLRANASRLSHAELDEAEELDDGNPEEFGQQHRELRLRLGHITVMGGCCGTDHRHIKAICDACSETQAA